jgi:hypothetical protein
MTFAQPFDLLNFRQVCKLWEGVTQNDIKKRLTFRIDHANEIKSFMDDAGKSFPTFRNLTLDLCGRSSVNYREDVRALFRKHGPYFQRLSLNFVGQDNAGHVVWTGLDLEFGRSSHYFS